MSWKKHFTSVNASGAPLRNSVAPERGGAQINKFSSVLPEIYAGHPNRIQRYYQYEDMARDSDISAALDTIADFCTQSEEQSDSPFTVTYLEDASDAEIKIITQSLKKWVKLNNFKAKLWKMFRDCAQNGDAFFIRDPEDHTWIWVDHMAVELVRMTDDGKERPEEYLIRNFKPVVTERLGTAVDDISKYRGMAAGNQSMAARPLGTSSASQFQMAGQDRDARSIRNNTTMQGKVAQHVSVKAENVVHLALAEERMGINYPFGQSILDPIFKTYKQKEMLEDAILIYRVQRAPERRIFYIDVGGMVGARAQSYIEGIKHDIHQRRLPNRTGGGNSIMDAAYNPLSIQDDYFFAQTADGRGSKVEVLPGGDSLGEITDLTYFTKKMARGLRVPTSYLNLGDDEQGSSYNDGKLGQAMIQEFRFNKFCMRLQGLLAPTFDQFFKDYLEASGVTIDDGIFELQFNPPQNFTRYRQIELDLQQTQVYSSVSGNVHLSERFKQERYLGLSPEEIIRNEELWAEENPDRMAAATGSTAAEMDASGSLSDIGFRSGGDDFVDDFSDDDFGDDFGDDLGEPSNDDISGDQLTGSAPAPAAAPTNPQGGE